MSQQTSGNGHHANGAGPQPVEVPPEDRPTMMGRLAERVGMTEGQLYTAVIAVVLALLISLTGLPGAHKRSGDDLLSGGGGVPVLTGPTTTDPATTEPTTAPDPSTPTSAPEESP